MLWKPGQNLPIYNFLKANADKVFFTYRGIDTFMFHHFGPYTSTHFNHFEEGVVTSHRHGGNILAGIVHMFEGLSDEEKGKYVFNR